jgi:hypothetical protein
MCLADCYGERQEGKLRILQHNGANLGLNFFVEQTMREVALSINNLLVPDALNLICSHNQLLFRVLTFSSPV